MGFLILRFLGSARAVPRGQARKPRASQGASPQVYGALKDPMNKVAEAKKAAEAKPIVRREETAAMRR